MASIEQTKDALEVQREQAAQMSDRALSAISDVVTLSSHTLTFVAVVLALVGVIGAVAIYVGSREMARKVATRRMDAYLRSDEGVAYVRRALADEVRTQIEQKIVVVVHPSETQTIPSTFPAPPTGGQP